MPASTSHRTSLILKFLESHLPQGGSATYDEIRAFPEIQDYIKKTNDSWTNTQINYTLRKHICPDLEPHIKLSINSDGIHYKVGRQTIFSSREADERDLKKAIGSALWHTVLGTPLSEGLCVSNSWQHLKSSSIKERIERKIDRIRANHILYCALDAGSTNLFAIRDLLEKEQIPIPVFPDRKFPDRKIKEKVRPRYIIPSILTNSIIAAYEIGNSSNASNIPVQIVGGTERYQERAIAGEVALRSLRSCYQDGHMISTGLSVIGVTSWEDNHHDAPLVTCNDPTEAQIKAKMLELGNLRILLMSPKKVNAHTGHSSFASASYPNVDIIITGVSPKSKSKGQMKNIKYLEEKSHEHGVGVIIVSSEELPYARDCG